MVKFANQQAPIRHVRVAQGKAQMGAGVVEGEYGFAAADDQEVESLQLDEPAAIGRKVGLVHDRGPNLSRVALP